MDRIIEPELMTDEAQVLAYAQADFAQVNQGFVDRFRVCFPKAKGGTMVDLGCGPGDIPVRFARALPGFTITAVDGSEPQRSSWMVIGIPQGTGTRLCMCLRSMNSRN